jgi:hypothetical protein
MRVHPPFPHLPWHPRRRHGDLFWRGGKGSQHAELAGSCRLDGGLEGRVNFPCLGDVCTGDHLIDIQVGVTSHVELVRDILYSCIMAVASGSFLQRGEIPYILLPTVLVPVQHLSNCFNTYIAHVNLL